MTVKLNVKRTQTIQVPVPVSADEFASFYCEMRILKATDDKDIKIVDLIVDVKGLELSEHGNVLSAQDTIKAIKDDSQLKALVENAWKLGNEKIAKKQQTLLQPPEH